MKQSYKIADLTVNMELRDSTLLALAQSYATEFVTTPHIELRCSESYLEEKHKENPHLTMGEVEEIFTLAELSHKLINFNAIVFHASAIEYEGGAYLFSADSQVGKSTHARLWQEYLGEDRVKLINDDKPIIRYAEEKLTVYGSPWSGGSGKSSNTKAPLKAIIFLERAEENSITVIDNTSKKLTAMLTQCKSRFWERETVILMNIIEKIINLVPIYSLKCNMSLDAAKTAVECIVKQKI